MINMKTGRINNVYSLYSLVSDCIFKGACLQFQNNKNISKIIIHNKKTNILKTIIYYFIILTVYYY